MTETARLYGDSLYELAAAEGMTEEIREQSGQVRVLFREYPDYLRLLSEPSIPKGERLGLIEEAFGETAERYLVNFLKILCERGMLGEYAGCCEEYARRYRADRGIAQAEVVSAVALTGEQMSALKEKLERQSGKTIELTQRTDPSVLGGIRVELEGMELDGTVKSRLSGIRKALEN